jgi:hypothetical protein
VTQRQSQIAFSAILFAVCHLAAIAAVLAYMGKYTEALGFGGLTTDPVGVLDTFKPKTGGATQNV